jgi:hypothetical protein
MIVFLSDRDARIRGIAMAGQPCKFCISTIIDGKKLKQFAAQGWGVA